MVVTIVVLLILAGVSISLILDNNGIIQKSKDAKREYGQAKENEQADLEKVSDWIEKQANGNSGNSTILPDETDETKPYLPSGFARDEDTNLDNGLVIRDNVGNEYVWIEVPRNAEVVYKTAGLNITEFSEEELTSIKTDLINYVTDYRSTGADEWNDKCGVSQTEYPVMYNKMLKSVYRNGGFWIGRYEMGIDENTTRSFESDLTTEYPVEEQTPVIKKNKVPYNWIKCSQAESLAEMFAPNGYTSSLMFGLQWDLVCKHLETKGTNPGITADSLQNAIKSNSTDWGNYHNASFTVTNTDAMYSEDNGATWNAVGANGYQKKENKPILFTTGVDERNSMMNIYDFAGNLSEWTLETGSCRPDSYRGGNCYFLGTCPASYRLDYSGSGHTDGNFGARVTLY